MAKHHNQLKVVLITGAARRIGAEIARTLHAEGFNIVMHYNSSENEALSLCEKLNQARPHSAAILRADLQLAESEKALVTKAVEIWGRLDALINNASRFYRTPFGETTEYAWDDLMGSNLKAPFFLSQAAAPHLRSANGCIVNIADIHATSPLVEYSVYSMSKAGLLMLTRILAKEMGPQVRVNAISPGSIIWPEGENTLSDQQKQKIIDQTALQRAGEPQDVAKAVLFFVKDAPYVTGQVLQVDGGRKL